MESYHSLCCIEGQCVFEHVLVKIMDSSTISLGLLDQQVSNNGFEVCQKVMMLNGCSTACASKLHNLSEADIWVTSQHFKRLGSKQQRQWILDLYRLTPDGTYQPVRNLSSLHHEIDESMWDESLPKKYGPSRASELFAELVAEERRIAEELLAEMDIPTEGNATAVVSHSYDRAAVEKRAEELRMAIADEINAAELSMQRLYPEMYVVE